MTAKASGGSRKGRRVNTEMFNFSKRTSEYGISKTVKTAKIKLFAIYVYISCVSLSVFSIINTSSTRSIVLGYFTINYVFSPGADPQVRPSVIERITINVVDNFFRGSLHYESM